MEDPIAVLYVIVDGLLYRFKVFDHHVWIERQSNPPGANMPFERFGSDEMEDLYNRLLNAWDYRAIGEAVATYEYATGGEED